MKTPIRPYLLTKNPVEPWTFQEIQDLSSCMDNTLFASQEFVSAHVKLSLYIYCSPSIRTTQHLGSTPHSTIIEKPFWTVHLQVFFPFEGLLTSTSHADSKDKGLSCIWQTFVERDDENDASYLNISR